MVACCALVLLYYYVHYLWCPCPACGQCLASSLRHLEPQAAQKPHHHSHSAAALQHHLTLSEGASETLSQ